MAAALTDVLAGAVFGAGILAGAVIALLVARRRGHVKINVEVGDPPDDRRTPRD